MRQAEPAPPRRQEESASTGPVHGSRSPDGMVATRGSAGVRLLRWRSGGEAFVGPSAINPGAPTADCDRDLAPPRLGR